MVIEHEISERYFELPSSEFAEIMRVAEEEKNIISLGPGEPDFITPRHIIEFAKKKLDEGYTHYSPPIGRKETREAIAKKLKRENKIDVDPDEIIVTCGSQEALFLASRSRRKSSSSQSRLSCLHTDDRNSNRSSSFCSSVRGKRF
jgi:aspartate/methionine/tyrosine aminotransferase